ncbi:response regulator transcription factor [bacterium]|nr:response regulator transcription factor [bacterium]MBU1636066.1 response regulator transcription factor [bacterium]MBU1920336.1 response regulator transcription factor [bacterium]
MIRVLIADDHAIIRTGIKQLLADTDDMIAAGEAADGQTVLDLLSHETYDVVVLDLSMPGRGGLDTLKQIKALYPDVAVLVLSMYPEEYYATRALRAGAAGYLTKQSATDELIEAIRRVGSGRKYITESLAEKLADEMNLSSGKELHHKLSDRELIVMQRLAIGFTATQIAAELSLSVKTISTYRDRILQKMQMKTNAELIQYVLSHNLLE